MERLSPRARFFWTAELCLFYWASNSHFDFIPMRQVYNHRLWVNNFSKVLFRLVETCTIQDTDPGHRAFLLWFAGTPLTERLVTLRLQLRAMPLDDASTHFQRQPPS